MLPDIVRSVLGRALVGHSAVLRGYARYRVRDAVYPAVAPEVGAEVRGIVYTDISDADWRRLDAYEGDMYERRLVDVDVDGKTTRAQCYVVAAGCTSSLSDQAWDLQEFVRDHASRFRVSWD